jgi:2'-5' RNA ligase
MTDISYCAIAALVEEPLKGRIIEISSKLEKSFGSWYVLSADRFPPHLTVWIAYIPSQNIEATGNALQIAAQSIPRFSVNVDRFEVEDSGFVSIRIANSETLRRIHYSLLEKLNSYRAGYIPPKYAEKLDSYPPGQRESITTFGTRFAGQLFSPHLTVGVIKPEYVSEARISLGEPETSPFNVCRLTLFRQGEEGRSIEVLNEVTLPA